MTKVQGTKLNFLEATGVNHDSSTTELAPNRTGTEGRQTKEILGFKSPVCSANTNKKEYLQ